MSVPFPSPPHPHLSMSDISVVPPHSGTIDFYGDGRQLTPPPSSPVPPTDSAAPPPPPPPPAAAVRPARKRIPWSARPRIVHVKFTWDGEGVARLFFVKPKTLRDKESNADIQQDRHKHKHKHKHKHSSSLGQHPPLSPRSSHAAAAASHGVRLISVPDNDPLRLPQHFQSAYHSGQLGNNPYIISPNDKKRLNVKSTLHKEKKPKQQLTARISPLEMDDVTAYDFIKPPREKKKKPYSKLPAHKTNWYLYPETPAITQTTETSTNTEQHPTHTRPSPPSNLSDLLSSRHHRADLPALLNALRQVESFQQTDNRSDPELYETALAQYRSMQQNLLQAKHKHSAAQPNKKPHEITPLEKKQQEETKEESREETKEGTEAQQNEEKKENRKEDDETEQNMSTVAEKEEEAEEERESKSNQQSERTRSEPTEAEAKPNLLPVDATDVASSLLHLIAHVTSSEEKAASPALSAASASEEPSGVGESKTSESVGSAVSVNDEDKMETEEAESTAESSTAVSSTSPSPPSPAAASTEPASTLDTIREAAEDNSTANSAAVDMNTESCDGPIAQPVPAAVSASAPSAPPSPAPAPPVQPVITTSLSSRFSPRQLIQFRARLQVLHHIIEKRPIPPYLLELAAFQNTQQQPRTRATTTTTSTTKQTQYYLSMEELAMKRQEWQQRQTQLQEEELNAPLQEPESDADLLRRIELRKKRLLSLYQKVKAEVLAAQSPVEEEVKSPTDATDTETRDASSTLLAVSMASPLPQPASTLVPSASTEEPSLPLGSLSSSLLDPLQFLVFRNTPRFTPFSIPSVRPLLPASAFQPAGFTATELLARMPARVHPLSQEFIDASNNNTAAVAAAAAASIVAAAATAKSKRDAGLAEAERRAAQRIKEQQEARQKKELDKQKKQLHKYFLSTLKAHRDAFVTFHKSRSKSLSSLAKMAVRSQEMEEKRRRAAEEKSKKERMRALKENDMTAYVELLKEHKNDRLSSLLKQTESYLKQLGAMIRGELQHEQRKPKPYIGQGRRRQKKTWEVGEKPRTRQHHQDTITVTPQLQQQPSQHPAQQQQDVTVPTKQEEMKGLYDLPALSSDVQKSESQMPAQIPLPQIPETDTEMKNEPATASPEQVEVKEDSSKMELTEPEEDEEEEDREAVTEEDEEEKVDEKEDVDLDAAIHDADVMMNTDHSSDDVLDLIRIRERITVQPSLFSGGTLKGYQMVGLEWLVSLYNNKMNGILADEMGLGKTIQTIALFCYLMEFKNNNGPFLVVVPLSTLNNWYNEFQRFAPAVHCIVYHGTLATRQQLWLNEVQSLDFNVLITTYDFIINKKDRPKLASIEWEVICVDEGHRMKNAESKLTTILGTKYSSKHRLILTGTPLQNSLRELWSLLNFLLPNIFNSAENFEDWFNAPFEHAGIADRTELDDEEKLLIINRLHQVLRPFLLRRLKREVADQLPEKIEIVLKCELSAWQWMMYHQIQNKALGGIDRRTGEIRAAKLSNTLMQLRKIVNHPYLFYDQLGLDWHQHQVGLEIVRCSGKFSLLHRMLPKLIRSHHRLLIFCQMTRVMDILEDYLEWKQYQWLRLDGHSASNERKEALEAFNAEDSPYQIFLLSTRAGGLGLNLQSADTVIIFDSDWNPQMDIQAQDRAHRIGQKREERARYKLGIDQMVIQSGKFNSESSADERRTLIQSVLREGVRHGAEVKAPTDTEINTLLARTPEEIELFNAIDKEMEAEDAIIWHKEAQEKLKAQASSSLSSSSLTAAAIGTHPTRLMQEDEVPAFIRSADQLMDAQRVKEEAKELGRGTDRGGKKALMSYSEELTDKEFERALERGSPANTYIYTRCLSNCW